MDDWSLRITSLIILLDSHDQSSPTATNLHMCFVCDLSILAPGQTNIEPSTQGFKPKPSIFGKAILNVLNLTAPDVRITGEVLLNENGNYIDIMSLSKKELIEYRPKMQMIFQDPFSSLNPRMIVKDIIREPLDIHTSLSKTEKTKPK